MAGEDVRDQLKISQFGLPRLSSVLDVDAIGRRISNAWASASGEDAPRITAVDVVAVKPGHRAVIAFRGEGPDGRPVYLYGKLFHDPRKAEFVYRVMLDFVRFCEDSKAAFQVPVPLAFDPHLRLILHAPARGEPFARARAAQDVPAWRSLAIALSQFHFASVTVKRSFDLSNELTNLDEWAEMVVTAQPGNAELVRRLLDVLVRASPRMRLETDTIIHKDLHPGHVFIDNRNVTFVDLDEVRRGDATFDLAHFCTYLNLHALHNGMDLVESQALERSFLEEYSAVTGWKRDQRFTYFEIYSCIKIAKQLVTLRGPHPVEDPEEQSRRVHSVLERGYVFASELHGSG